MGPNLFDTFEEEPQIDLTPLIDCLFILIIFFVLTMSFSRPVLEIILPEAKNAEEHAERNERRGGIYNDKLFCFCGHKNTPLTLISITVKGADYY